MKITEGPFKGFDSGLRRILVTLPENMRPTHSMYMASNEEGGILFDTAGNMWWIPQHGGEPS